MRRAVVSGVTGFVGQELARQLARAGFAVHGLTRSPPDSHQRAATLELHRIDGSTQTLIRTLEAVQPDVVFHLAALARREHRSDDILPFVAANVTFGTQLLEAMRLSGCTCFITAGSYLQYTDTGASRALNLYAATKHAFSRILEYYIDAFGIAAADLTLCNIYGESDRRPQLITDVAAALVQASPLTLHGEEAWVDLVHVEDVAAAFIQVAPLLSNHDDGKLLRYSVTSGKDVSATELIALFERIGARKLHVRRQQSSQSSHRRTRPWRGAVVPGWIPHVSIEAGIERLLCHTNK